MAASRRPRIPEAVRLAWADLAARYRWLYDMTLQERLDTQLVREDVTAWWNIGGVRESPPTHFG